MARVREMLGFTTQNRSGAKRSTKPIVAPHEYANQYGPPKTNIADYKKWLAHPSRHIHGFVTHLKPPTKDGRVIYLDTGPGKSERANHRSPSPIATLRWDDGESPSWHNVIRALEAA